MWPKSQTPCGGPAPGLSRDPARGIRPARVTWDHRSELRSPRPTVPPCDDSSVSTLVDIAIFVAVLIGIVALILAIAAWRGRSSDRP